MLAYPRAIPGCVRNAMTSRPLSRPAAEKGMGKFPELPPRDDMQNPLYLYRPGHLSALEWHFNSLETTLIMGEVPVGWRHNVSLGMRRPDLTIAFNVDAARIIADEGYSIEVIGKPPDFVLEVASKSTGEGDYIGKRRDYAAFGIPEYWRFDPSGGIYHDAPLAGDRLADGEYRP